LKVDTLAQARSRFGTRLIDRSLGGRSKVERHFLPTGRKSMLRLADSALRRAGEAPQIATSIGTYGTALRSFSVSDIGETT